jgi:hypothetical protein
MIQNAFRRIALAQGLLPERLQPGEGPTQSAASEAGRDAAEADRDRRDGWRRDAERREGRAG